MHNGNNRRQGPPPGKGMNAGEKPKDFKNSIVRLAKSLDKDSKEVIEEQENKDNKDKQLIDFNKEEWKDIVKILDNVLI